MGAGARWQEITQWGPIGRQRKAGNDRKLGDKSLAKKGGERWESLKSKSNLLLTLLSLLLLLSLQSCPTLCDPIDGSAPGSPILGFSRQEHWSGLPFPSPVHESGK